MRKFFAITLLLALSAALLTPEAPVNAQRPTGTFPVIVVFRDDAPLAGFVGRQDERARANPAAWNYHDRGTLGAIQSLEARLAFRAERAYSATIRGFAGRLTAAQIAAIESDPMVAYVVADGEAHTTAQTLPWGIDKVDADVSSTLAGNGSGAITNVNVYVIDSGVYAHPDINLVGHVNFAGGKNEDCNGHGTHVAGTIAARDNADYVVGVAP
ncbi:MAG TPA: S8 family serine peptidase, partial [Pyrinomonadaceae bacterium]|nr:S8 family serine peptidase [Pyrinomonadaceae bacterium]